LPPFRRIGLMKASAVPASDDCAVAKEPRVTFGVIVLNGEPFTRYCLRALYPFAHQIVVVEGAVPAAAGVASPDGHSTDGTLDTLHAFKRSEDPEGKLLIVTAEDNGHPNGFWPGEKHEQSGAFARRATGDYLWQVDIDEFYRPDDMRTVLKLLRDDPQVTAMSFKQISFWGGFDYVVDGWYLRRGADIYHRLFRWRPEYRYVTHRPPTVTDESGRDLRSVGWISGNELAKDGVHLYHYSLTFPKQVHEKCAYYQAADWAARGRARNWAENEYARLSNPFRVHNIYGLPSWLERFRGQHPEQIEALRRDIVEGRLLIELRPIHDVEQLLRSPLYRIARFGVKLLDPVHRWLLRGGRWLRTPADLLRRGVLKGGRLFTMTATEVLQRLRHLLAKYHRRLRLRLNDWFVKHLSVDIVTGSRVHKVPGLERIGSEYGGWIIPTSLIGAGSICYCVGVGEDISFDLAIISRFDCQVYAFDPTPRARQYVEQHAGDEQNLHFSEIGLWEHDGVVRFYAPRDPAHVSHSIVNLQRTDTFFEAPCKRLSTVLKENGHRRIDLLKMDIEGAEYRVVDSIIEDELDIGIICVEYDEAWNKLDEAYVRRIRKSVSRLRKYGYSMVAVDQRCDYTFVKNSLLRASNGNGDASGPGEA
jgi:FkbM family methyltransferase